MNLSCIIIDDEADAIEVLGQMLNIYCPDLTVVHSCPSIFEGLKAIRKYKPDLVFLDIAMPGGSGLELAQEIDPATTKIIFTTAFQSYSFHAIKSMHLIIY